LDHTSFSLTITENDDPDVQRDILIRARRGLQPMADGPEYQHDVERAGDIAAH
jgi:thiamine phosphate synthase YjbQ (UPF0047 family)